MEHKNEKDKSRRDFFSFLIPKNEIAKKEDDQNKSEMVKMLTADGKIVEVKKSILEAASNKQKSSNQEIYDWMDNPSKEIK